MTDLTEFDLLPYLLFPSASFHNTSHTTNEHKMTDLTEFHPFPRLPKELRVIIWNFALRPLDRRGVHIFNVVERITQLKHGTHSLPLPVGKGGSDLYGLFVLPSLLPQRAWTPPMNGSCSWVSSLYTYVVFGDLKATATPSESSSSSRKEPDVCSTYLLDGGLWTACTESRKVIKKAFSSPKTDEPSTTTCFLRNLGRRHPFTVFQGRDLFIYRPMYCPWSPMRHRDRARGGGEQLVPGWELAPIYKLVPRWERLLCGEPNRPLEYYQPNYRHLDKLGHYQDHMAIEWDPAWSSNTDAFKELTSGLVFPSLQRGYTWFIDYGLEPKHDNVAITDLNLKRAPKDSEEVLVFDDAHGGRYVEVYFYENDLNPHTGERVGRVCFDGTGLFMSTDGSLARLKELFREDLPKKMRSMRVSSGGKDWVQWGILAYLPPPSRRVLKRANDP